MKFIKLFKGAAQLLSPLTLNLFQNKQWLFLLKQFYKFHFDVLNAKLDITECFMVIFVEQRDKIFLYCTLFKTLPKIN